MLKIANNVLIHILKNEICNELVYLTYKRNIQYIKNRVNEEYLKCNSINILNEPENKQYITTQLSIIYLKIMKPYFKYLIEKIKYLDSIPIVEQRSEEWFNQRNNLLSASSIYKVLGSVNDINTIVKEKIGIKKPFIQCDATIHGTVFEEVSQKLYELRNGIILKEYGCIPHKLYNYIGASPDGLVHDIPNIDIYTLDFDDPDLTIHPSITINSLSYFGKLIEIKNPYSRDITNKIPKNYDKQMLLQEEVCGIQICDYLETNYNFYESLEDFMSDVFEFDLTKDLSIEEEDNFIKNSNIPLSNLTKDGVEKGILLQFKKSDESGNKYSGIVYDIKKTYSKDNIKTWIKDSIHEKNKDGFELDKQFLWSIKTFDIKEHKYDATISKTILDKSKEVWNRILEERKLNDNEIIAKYKNLELIDTNIETIDIINKKRKYDSTYELRNIQKKSRRIIYNF